MPEMRRAVLFVVLVITAAGACSDDDDPASEPVTEPSTSATTATTEAPTTTTTIDVTQVPDEITVPYVEAVLTELERINGDALRLAVAADAVPQEAQALIRAIFTPDQADLQIGSLIEGLAFDTSQYQDPVGTAAVSDVAIVAEDAPCLAIDADYDFGAVSNAGLLRLRVELRAVSERQAPNETGWVYAYLRPITPSEELPEPCVG